MVKQRSLWSRVLGLSEPAAQDQRVIVVHDQAIGSPGTESYMGYASEEYLQALRGTDRADVFDKMRRGDPQCEMLLMATKSPIIGATWEIQPGRIGEEEATDEAKQDADLIRHILFDDMGKTWEENLEEDLTVVDFGHSVKEVTHKAVVGHKRFGSYNGIKNLMWVSPRTIDRWNLNPDGTLKSISQMAHGDLQRMIEIPAEFLMVFNVKKEGSNFEGRSFLRHCYGSWLRKNTYMKLNAVGIEKFAVPTPIASVPEGKQSSPEYERLIASLQAYTQHHKNFIIKPDGWEIDLTTNTYDPQKVEVSIDNEDKRMAKGFLMNFLELGMNGFGSQSLSVDLSDFSLGCLKYVAGKICAPYNRHLIPQLINMNRGPRDVYPQLVASGIDDKAGQELANTLKAFADGKMLTPDDPLEANIRKRYRLPPMSEEGREDRKAAAPSPMQNPNLGLAERVRWAIKK